MAKQARSETAGYRRDGIDPPYPDYKATRLWAPVYGHERVEPLDHDLTRQHKGEPLGERGSLVEIWQANAADPVLTSIEDEDLRSTLVALAGGLRFDVYLQTAFFDV